MAATYCWLSTLPKILIANRLGGGLWYCARLTPLLAVLWLHAQILIANRLGGCGICTWLDVLVLWHVHVMQMSQRYSLDDDVDEDDKDGSC